MIIRPEEIHLKEEMQMSLDGLSVHCLVHELAEELESGRISKVYQPSKTEIIFQLRKHGQNKKVLLSIHPTYGRIHITNRKYDTPKEPPMFCMTLRKYMEGAILEKVVQKDLERLIELHIQSRDEIGDLQQTILILELMGRHSNLSLVQETKENEYKILACMKQLGYNVNRYRAMIPGFVYNYPPEQKKIVPFHLEAQDIITKIHWNEGKIDKQLIGSFLGLSPQLAKEIIYRAGIVNQNTLPDAFHSVVTPFETFRIEPQITQTVQKESFSLIPLTHLAGNVEKFSTISQMLDAFFSEKALRDRVKQVASDLEMKMEKELEKYERKLGKLQEELQTAKDATLYQKYGELLTTYAYQIEKGQKSAQLLDYYCEEETYVTIPLNEQETAIENAQRYFKRYNKQKNAVPVIQEQIQITKEDIQYITLILSQIENASVRDIEEIREELQEVGYLRNRDKQKKSKPKKPVIDTYLAPDGTEIFVGKNNKQNDYLTNKFARRSDIWLHAKDIPGSHVIIHHPQPSNETLEMAAELAAYFSKGKLSTQVPVDYTLVKNVKKVRGAKPGFVTYDEQKTLYVTPKHYPLEQKVSDA